MAPFVAPDATARLPMPSPIDLRRTLGPLRHGYGDPTIRIGEDGVWLARATAEGPATLRLAAVGALGAGPVGDGGSGGGILAEAWGPGARLALEAAPGLAGLLDDPSALVPRHPLIRELARRFAGLRMTRTGQLLPALIPAVIGQKVTATEALAAFAGIVERFGEPAPGPAGLRLPPTGERLASLPYFELHPFGLERRRAELLRRVGELAARIESWLELPPSEAALRLQAIPGIGPWTAAEATRAAFGDSDAVTLGDAHIPDLVSWALARQPRADDARMLELLAPYPGQRARVVLLLETSGVKIPRFGPRFTPGRFERL